MQAEQGTETSHLDCAACGHDWDVVGAKNEATCPSCHRSYSLVVHKEFALMERDGWTTRVTLGEPAGLPSEVANG